jgi:CHAT domain-containing protein/Tfp pilus assembly protein PilF
MTKTCAGRQQSVLRAWRGAGAIAVVVVAVAGCGGAQTGGGVASGDANTLLQQGIQATKQGRYTEAEPLLRGALAGRESAYGADRPEVSYAVFNLGWLYRLEGRYSEAEPLVRRALSIQEKSLGAENPTVAVTLVEVGYIYQLQGRYADAEPLYRRALAIQTKALPPNDPATAFTLNDLGYLYRVTGRYAEAEPLYKQALAMREKASGSDSAPVAVVLANLGNLYRLQGRYAEAEPLEKRALAIRRAALGPEHPEVADSLNDLGDLYASQRRYGEAEPNLQGALAIWEKVLGPDHPLVATRSLSSLSLLYQAEGKTDAALAASTRAVGILERHLLHSANQRSASSATERRLYREDFLRNVALLDATGARTPGAVDQSFQVAQYASASTAGQAVASMAARFASGSDSLASRIRDLQNLTDRWRQLEEATVTAASRPGSEGGGGSEAAARGSLEDTERQLDALEAGIERDYPAYANLTNPKPLSVATVQKLLAPDEAMLVYLVGDDATFLWAVRQDRAALFRVSMGAKELTAEVTALRAKLDPWQNPSATPFPARRAYALYQRIMAPAAGFLDGARHVLVVPDGALESLPLAVLVTQPPAADPAGFADNRAIVWFAKDHALTVLPTVGSLQALRSFAATSHATSPFTGIGDPALAGPSAPQRSAGAAGGLGQTLAQPVRVQPASLFRGATVDVAAVRELPPLPETALELRLISHVMGASESDLYLRDRASEQVIRGAHLDRYRIVEFATHGLMSGDLGLGEPALVLTPPDVARPDNDGLLTASKIATMKFDADWVVLSACNTAASDGSPDAEGLSGLAKAFFYAGARSMLVSHWSVDSAATVRLTTGAFSALTKDPSIGRAEALRRSMMAMMDPANPVELSHPMAWAPFVLAGEGGAGR